MSSFSLHSSVVWVAPPTASIFHSFLAPFSGATSDLIGSISQAIRSGLATRIVTIQHAGEMAGMGVRTLQRKLSAEGLIDSNLVDRVRFEEAGKLLAEADLKIAEISHSLGYSDPANFTHAFQRWSGITPSTYRAGTLEGIH